MGTELFPIIDQRYLTATRIAAAMRDPAPPTIMATPSISDGGSSSSISGATEVAVSDATRIEFQDTLL
jgi:hypothetical protein